MECPWCGSTGEICGDFWKCGWCGDFGSLQRMLTKKSTSNTAQITLTLSFVYHLDLNETWSKLKKAIDQLAPNNTHLPQLLRKVLLHHILNNLFARRKYLCTWRGFSSLAIAKRCAAGCFPGKSQWISILTM